jgi:hypothetical protein
MIMNKCNKGVSNNSKEVLLSFINLILFLFFTLNFSSAQTKQEFRKIENKAFKVGEKLSFDINYGFITAGIAEYNIPKIMKLAGRDVFQIQFFVNSVSTFDVLYKVRDRYETYVDVEGLFPWRFEQHIREGGYSRDFSAFFDHRKGKARTSEGAYDIPKYVNDIVSAFYLARTIDFTKMKNGDKVNLVNFYKDKVYPLDVIYKGKETVSVKAGTFECFILEPVVQEGGLIRNTGNIVIWITNDELKVPVKLKTKIIIGAIDVELSGYSGLNGEPKAKKK